MVVEERTKRKDTAQHTKEETKAMENFLRVRYGMTNTEVSLILGQYGAATIEMLRQGIHEETLANALYSPQNFLTDPAIKKRTITYPPTAPVQVIRISESSTPHARYRFDNETSASG